MAKGKNRLDADHDAIQNLLDKLTPPTNINNLENRNG